MDLERLNFLFKAAGITKKELAKLLDINAQSIYAWDKKAADWSQYFV